MMRVLSLPPAFPLIIEAWIDSRRLMITSMYVDVKIIATIEFRRFTTLGCMSIMSQSHHGIVDAPEAFGSTSKQVSSHSSVNFH